MGESQRRKPRIEIRKKQKRKLIQKIRYSILFIIIVILVCMAYGIYKEARIQTYLSEGDMQNEQETNIESASKEKEGKNIRKIRMPEVPVAQKYAGHQVDSRLEIPKIKLMTNVLANYSTEGLKVCASKYYGPKANEVGNYCIAGHNYNKENMFNHLIDLKIKDTIRLIDNTNGIVEYEVYDIYKVRPENTEPLSQETEGKKELTLITCVNYSKNRLVIKAVQKEEENLSGTV